jgi:hypothetical protein
VRSAIPTWAGFLAGLVVIAVANHALLQYLCTRNPARANNWLIGGDPDDYDYVVLGASPAYNGLDTVLLGDMLDGRVLSLAKPGTAFPEQLLELELFLERSRADTLVFQVDTWGLSGHTYTYPFHEYLYLPYVDDPTVARHLEARYGAARVALWRWLPMYRFAEFNHKIGLRDALDLLTGEPAFDPHESHLLDEHGTFLTDVEPVTYDLSDERVSAFRGILDAAGRHGTDVVIFLAPVHERFAALERNRGEVIEFYAAEARARDIPFFALDDGQFLASRDNFYNLRHLNARGASLFTRRLGEFIRNRGRTALAR